jgi:hypothetical protein
MYPESFEMWFWRVMEKISWADRVKNEEVLYRFKENRNILRKIKEGNLNGWMVTSCSVTTF